MKIKKTLLVLGLIPLFFILSKPTLAAEKTKITFVDPDVSEKMDQLNWALPALKEWRRRPIEKVNNGRDGKFNLTVKVQNFSTGVVNTVPRIKICPIPEAPDRCWEQEVITPIGANGVFKCFVYFNLNNWSKHILHFKIGDEKIEVVIDEDPF